MRIPRGSSDSSLAKIDPIVRADLGVGPVGSAPSFVVYQIFQHSIGAFAKLHLRELPSPKFFRRSMRPKLSKKMRRSQS